MTETKEEVHYNINRVLIIGQAGVGKSSLVNLLTGTTCAATSDNAVGCTFEYNSYHAQYQNLIFELIDTVGLNESSKGTVPPAAALKKLVKFIRENKQGFNCVLIAMKKGRIDKAFEDNHKLFCKSLLKKQIPVLLYIGHCEDDDPMNTWISKQPNMIALAPYEFQQWICGTTKEGGRFADEIRPLRTQTYSAIWEAITTKMLSQPCSMEPDLNVFKKTWNQVCDFMGFRWKFVTAAFQEFLNHLRGMGFTDHEINDINLAFH